MALNILLITLVVFVLLIVSISSLVLFLKRRRRPKSNLTLQRHKEEEKLEGSWLLPAVDPTLTPPAEDERGEEESPAASGGGGGGGPEEKRKKKKAKKKQRSGEEEAAGGFPCSERDWAAAAAGEGKAGSLFPFSSSASATQRKIKAQYDELVKSNQAKQLTMAQVGQFVNCLVEARNVLQQKSEVIQRSFKIKKALLVKADRSSFDRLCQQIYKLETEHKRLEEDVAVYNLLQDQLKLSPAYKTMLEISAEMELKGMQDQAVDVDFCDISFEELLAQEKKDTFWQRNGKLRSFSS